VGLSGNIFNVGSAAFLLGWENSIVAIRAMHSYQLFKLEKQERGHKLHTK